MISFLNGIFRKTDTVKFHKFAPFVSLLADVILIFYINRVMIPRLLDRDVFFATMVKINPDIRFLPESEILYVKAIMESTLSFAFLAILVFNTVAYFLASRQFNWAVKFVYGYTLSAAALSILELIGTLFAPYPLSWATALTMLMYFYVYWGMRYFKQNQAQ